ncbi:uncharacterized protein LOC62_04G005870 [Vanrija pseudolonga]|uniref:Survival Motor Neuron Gemin2-binding domain-containing protein n=1 Tax=Vanrija pseudolonga TaxID=143232 RepID=A0AAF1BLM5_9TREE|nr:hypothetical protein LOC62_04G005870 [Vanrija pseudolonga]
MASASTEPLPTVTLDFNNKSGGAWDDRELVNAYDAALLEFHLHNPGPGSWLDKATAALAKGQPLPGANAFDTEWYSASKPQVTAAAAASSSTPTPRQNKRARTSRQDNPYTSQAGTSRQESPSYSPPSPAGPEDGEGEGEGEEDEDEGYGQWQGYDGEGDEWGAPEYADQDDAYVFPPPQGAWGAAAGSRDEAIGYALHAQYWAGYWMGVARASGPGQGQQGHQGPAAEVQAAAPPRQFKRGRGNFPQQLKR